MAQWRPLPPELGSEARYLVGQLRRMKDRTELSLAALAGKTAYSKSSWERYLNGKKQPPRQAVLALAGLAGADTGRLGALWELADGSWHRAGGGDGAARPATAAGPAGRPKGPAGTEGPEPSGVSGFSQAPGEGAAGRSDRAGDGAARAGAGGPCGPDRPAGEPRRGPGPLRSRGRRRTLLAAVTALLVALVVPAALWSAGVFGGGGPDCRGDACRGRDAREAGCASAAEVISSVRHAGVGVKLWHSRSCRSVWGEGDMGGRGLGVEVAYEDPAKPGTVDSMSSEPEARGRVRSPMLVPPGPLRYVSACVFHERRTVQICAQGDGTTSVAEVEAVEQDAEGGMPEGGMPDGDVPEGGMPWRDVPEGEDMPGGGPGPGAGPPPSDSADPGSEARPTARLPVPSPARAP